MNVAKPLNCLSCFPISWTSPAAPAAARLHSGYSSNLLQSVHPPRQKKIRRASTIVALPSAAPTSRFWSHRVGLPLESDYSRGFLACVVSSTAQFVSRSTAAHCCLHQCAGWRGVAARFSQQFTAGSLQTLLPSTVSPCSHLPAAGSLPAVFLGPEAPHTARDHHDTMVLAPCRLRARSARSGSDRRALVRRAATLRKQRCA